LDTDTNTPIQTPIFKIFTAQKKGKKSLIKCNSYYSTDIKCEANGSKTETVSRNYAIIVRTVFVAQPSSPKQLSPTQLNSAKLKPLGKVKWEKQK